MQMRAKATYPELARAYRSTVLSIALVAAGCDIEAESTEDIEQTGVEEVGSSIEAFSNHGLSALAVSAPTTTVVANSTTNTIFLNGATGNFTNLQPTVFGAGVSLPTYANGDVLLSVSPYSGSGRSMGGVAISVQSTAGRTVGAAYFNTAPAGQASAPAVDLGTTGGGRRCFLLSAINQDPNGNGFSASSDVLKVFEQAGHFWLGGSGRVYGSARCINVTQHLGVVAWSGSATTDILDLGPTAAGKACFLTGIGGSFRSNDTQDGVQVFIDGGANRWVMKVSAGKTGVAECNI